MKPKKIIIFAPVETYYDSTYTSLIQNKKQNVCLHIILPINVTQQIADEIVIPASALAVVVVPVYGGHVAPLAMERFHPPPKEYGEAVFHFYAT